MKNKLIAAVAALTLSATLAVAAPGGKHDGKRGRGGEFGTRFAQKLNLTDAQKAQIKAIREETHQQNATFFQNLRDTRMQLREAKKAGDTQRADALKATIESQRAQLEQIRESEKARILAVLTPEQRTEYERLEAEAKARNGNRGHRGGKRP